MIDTHPGWRFLRSKRWFGYLTMLLIFAVACALLGNWQFARRAEARAEIARIDNNYDAAPQPISQAIPDPRHFDEAKDKWLPVSATGRYIGQPIVARNRPGPTGVGVILLQAFAVDNGPVLFVDRGWVKATLGDGAKIHGKLPAAPPGKVNLVVRLRGSEPAISGRSALKNSVASIEIRALRQQLKPQPQEVYAEVYGMLVSESPAAQHGILPPRPERDEGPHLSYALQWYVFIVIAIVGVGYASRLEYRALNTGSKTLQTQNARKAARKARRGLSDAEEEDLLLDD